MNTKKPAVETLTIGSGLEDCRHHACVVDEAGEILAEEAIVNTREVVTAFCGRYPGATIVMETGTHSPWMSRLVTSLGHPVIVANARKLRAISQSQSRTARTRRCWRAWGALIRSCSARCANAATPRNARSCSSKCARRYGLRANRAVVTADYARDIGSVSGQESLQSAGRMRNRFGLHPTTLSARAGCADAGPVAFVSSARTSVRFVTLPHWLCLRRQPW